MRRLRETDRRCQFSLHSEQGSFCLALIFRYAEPVLRTLARIGRSNQWNLVLGAATGFATRIFAAKVGVIYFILAHS